jgi:hypothetical protein
MPVINGRLSGHDSVGISFVGTQLFPKAGVSLSDRVMGASAPLSPVQEMPHPF